MKVTTPLQQTETLSRIRSEMQRLKDNAFVGGDIVDASLELLYSLESAMKSQDVTDKKLYSEYEKVLARLSVEMLSFISTSDALSFINLYFSIYIELDALGELVLFNKLRAFFLREDFYKNREKLLSSVLSSIRKSSSKIGEKTVSQWIDLYVQSFGAEHHDKVTIREFIRNTKEPKKLSIPKRNVLSRTLRYYEALRMDMYDVSNPACDPLSLWGVDPRQTNLDLDLYDIRRPEREILEETPAPEKIAEKPRPARPEPKKSPQIQESRVPTGAPRKKDIIKTSSLRKEPVSKPRNSQMTPEEMMRSAQIKTHSSQNSSPVKDTSGHQSQSTPSKYSSKQAARHKALHSLSVDDLATFGNTASEAMRSFESLIQDLKKTRSSEQILAEWKKSPLYGLYLSMGKESMQKGVSIADLAQTYQSENKPYLTQQQFEIVARISSLM